MSVDVLNEAVWDLDCVFFCFTQCAHGFVNIWWCQWMCWMSRAQCVLLLVAWESDWVFFVFYNSVRLIMLEFGDVSGCAEWAVPIVICCWWCETWIVFSLCFTQCGHGFVNVWWCQWMCWMSRAQCVLLLVAWESDWVFFVFYNTVRLILLRFGDVSGC